MLSILTKILGLIYKGLVISPWDDLAGMCGASTIVEKVNTKEMQKFISCSCFFAFFAALLFYGIQGI